MHHSTKSPPEPRIKTLDVERRRKLSKSGDIVVYRCDGRTVILDLFARLMVAGVAK